MCTKLERWVLVARGKPKAHPRKQRAAVPGLAALGQIISSNPWPSLRAKIFVLGLVEFICRAVSAMEAYTGLYAT
jgi:hypothetical protein